MIVQYPREQSRVQRARVLAQVPRERHGRDRAPMRRVARRVANLVEARPIEAGGRGGRTTLASEGGIVLLGRAEGNLRFCFCGGRSVGQSGGERLAGSAAEGRDNDDDRGRNE